jgi:hypothetical protein
VAVGEEDLVEKLKALDVALGQLELPFRSEYPI